MATQTRPSADSAREAARRGDGQFGVQTRAEADDIDLGLDGGAATGSVVSETDYAMDASDFWPQRPGAAPVPPEQHEAAAAVTTFDSLAGRYARPSEILDTEWAALAHHPSAPVREMVAQHARQRSVIGGLSRDPAEAVRFEVASNPYASDETLEALTKDPDQGVSRLASVAQTLRAADAKKARRLAAAARLATPRATSAQADTAYTIDSEQRQIIGDQIGRMNVLSISGGRVNPLPDGVEMPVSNGYRVRVRLSPDDTYSVQRVFVRAGKEFDKGTVTGIYNDQVGETAYRASCFHDEEPFGKQA